MQQKAAIQLNPNVGGQRTTTPPALGVDIPSDGTRGAIAVRRISIHLEVIIRDGFHGDFERKFIPILCHF